MCGICGYIGPKLISDQILEQMNNTMEHRGPNDAGIWNVEQTSHAVGMGQRRLSILDLSELGHQPMISKNGNYIIVFNGEIYNFKVIRKQLEEKGYSFSSDCDTEVILYAYQEWGIKCFVKFNGMFAIALYDVLDETMILARDRVGKKPLYYYWKKEHFVFASELKPILLYPFFEKELNTEWIGSFLCNKYIAAPNSIYQNVYKVLPGEYIVIKNGSIKKERYWNILLSANEPKLDLSFAESKKELQNLLLDAVEKRLIADVPIGTFLSGGIDSTLISALTKDVTEKKIDTYTIGFYEKERDEAPFALDIAKYLGTTHHEEYITEEQLLEMLNELPKYYDEPFSDSSQLPSMLVSKMASKDITVALSGDGGDELFCGYKMYDLVYIAQKVDFIGALSNFTMGNLQIKESLPSEIRALINNRQAETRTQLFTDVMIEEIREILKVPIQHAKSTFEKSSIKKNWQEQRMLLDFQAYLPDDILVKMDRASMKYSLEVRNPILDYKVVEFATRMPHNYKYHKFNKKHILKELTYEYVPKELLDRPKKGFGVPLRKWIRTHLKDRILRYADKRILQKQGIFDGEAIARLIEKQEKSDKIVYSSIIWSFYIFQQWYQMYIEDLWN